MPNLFSHIDCIPPNAQLFSGQATLYILEDTKKEAVMKQINKGRGPTMRHISRTHRMNLDWLCGQINLDPTINTKNVNTKQQLAHRLTKGSLLNRKMDAIVGVV